MDAARRLRRMSAHGAATNGDLLLFDEVLRALPEDTRFFVDLKDGHAGHLLTAVGKGARRCGADLRRFLLACADPRGRGELGA